jgi:hypothetical protein
MLPLSADTPLSDVIKSRTTWSGQPGGNAEDYLLLNKLGSQPPQRMVAIPLVARGKAAAVLYADSAELDADAINLEALETLMRVAGMAVELSTMPRSQGQRVETSQAAQAPAAAAPPAQPEEAHEEARVSAPAEAPQAEETYAPQPSTFEAAPQAAEEQGTSSSYAPAYEPEQAEIGEETLVMETPSAQQAEASTQSHEATEATPEPPQPPPSMPSGQYVSPLGAARVYGRAADAAELPVEVASDDERRLHNDARRFARLLVSEIKLYNKDKVEEGRQEGNLYDRLREDIDRSRQMYDKRVAPPVAARFDYFHQELVNTLAEGDPSKLGAEYPGAAV